MEKPSKYDFLFLAISKSMDLVKNGNCGEAIDILENILDELEEVEEFSILINFAQKIVSVLAECGGKGVNLLYKLYGFVKKCVNMKDVSQSLAYSKFLALLSNVLHNFGEGVLDYLFEAEKILYNLATEHGLVKDYASFVRLYYAPILMDLGLTKKAIKSLEIVEDELLYSYNRERDKSLYLLLGEVLAYKGEILLKIGDYAGAINSLEHAFEIFKQVGEEENIDYIVVIAMNIVLASIKSGKNNLTKKYLNILEKYAEKNEKIADFIKKIKNE